MMRRGARWLLAIALASILLALGCSGEGARSVSDASVDLASPADQVAPRDVGTQPADHTVADQLGVDAAGALLRFGALADVHGAAAKLGGLVDALVADGASFLVLLGDLGSSKASIVATIERAAASGLPVYVFAGNSETKASYEQALAEVAAKHSTVTDLSPHGSFSRGGVTFVALGGYHLQQWLPSGGFLYGAGELVAVEAALEAAQGPTVLLSHGPPKSAGAEGIDFVPGAGNVGDDGLAALLQRQAPLLSICGHIHEAGQRAVGPSDQQLPAGVFAAPIRLNAAAVVDGKASLVEILDGQARFSPVS